MSAIPPSRAAESIAFLEQALKDLCCQAGEEVVYDVVGAEQLRVAIADVLQMVRRIELTFVPAQCCPVCNGVKTLPPNFYTQMQSTSSLSRITCETCNGAGIIPMMKE